MGKRYKNKKTSRKPKNYYSKKQQEDAFFQIVFVILVFVLLWILFWLGVILLTILLLKYNHKFNKYFNLYDTKYYYGAITTFFISILIILFGGGQIAYNMGKINNTFWGWAIESSDYGKIGKSNGKMYIEPNTEGMIQNSVIEGFTSTGNNIK